MIALPCALHGATKRETRGSPIFYLTFHYVFINRCDTTYIYIHSIPRIKICCISNQYTIILSIQHTSLYTLIYPLGSMYGIYAKIGDILMGSMLPYIAYMDIHGSYGYIYIYTLHTCIIHTYHAWRGAQKIHRTHWANQTIPTDRIHRLGVAWSRVHVTRGTSGRWRKMPTRSPWRFIAGKIIYKWDKWPICWSCKLAKISGSCSIDVGFFRVPLKRGYWLHDPAW